MSCSRPAGPRSLQTALEAFINESQHSPVLPAIIKVLCQNPRVVQLLFMDLDGQVKDPHSAVNIGIPFSHLQD